MFNKIKKFVAPLFLATTAVSTISCDFFQNAEQEEKRVYHSFADQSALIDYQGNIFLFSILRRFKSLDSTIQIEIDKDFLSTILPSQFKNSTRDNLDEVIKFKDKTLYNKFLLDYFIPDDEKGDLYLIFKPLDDAYFEIDGVYYYKISGLKRRYMDFEFPQEVLNKNKISYLNNVGNEVKLASGKFVNYLKNEDGSYPLKWFLLTAGHPLIDKFDLEEFDLEIFNLEHNLNVKATVFWDGRDYWPNTKKYQPTNLSAHYADNYSTFLDFAFVEINFENEEDAKKFTNMDEMNYINEKKHFPVDKNLGFYDIRYNDQNQKEVFFNNIDGDYRRHQLYEIKYSDTQNVMGTTIYSPFVGGEEILKIKDKYYVNATRTLAVTDSNLPSGSSGTVYSFDGENLFIKISSLENQNMGLWLPTSKLFFDPIENYIYEDIYGKKSEYIADRKFDFSLLVHTWYDPKMNNFLAHFKDKYNDISRIGVNYIYVHDGKFFEETESPIRKFYQ